MNRERRKISVRPYTRKSYGMIFQAPPTVAVLVLAPKYMTRDPDERRQMLIQQCFELNQYICWQWKSLIYVFEAYKSILK